MYQKLFIIHTFDKNYDMIFIRNTFIRNLSLKFVSSQKMILLIKSWNDFGEKELSLKWGIFYFKRTNFRGQKLSRISRILVQSAKVCPAKNFALLDPRKFMFAKCFKIGHPRKFLSAKVCTFKVHTQYEPKKS